ncbi:MAG: hypothetical protein RR932_11635, partial [Acinetobacter sp.]
ILSLRQVGHLISRVIRISLFYQNSTYFVSAYFLKHHPFFNSDILLFPTPYIKLLFVDLPIINSFFIWISYYIEIALRDIKQ